MRKKKRFSLGKQIPNEKKKPYGKIEPNFEIYLLKIWVEQVTRVVWCHRKKKEKEKIKSVKFQMPVNLWPLERERERLSFEDFFNDGLKFICDGLSIL